MMTITILMWSSEVAKENSERIPLTTVWWSYQVYFAHSQPQIFYTTDKKIVMKWCKELSVRQIDILWEDQREYSHEKLWEGELSQSCSQNTDKSESFVFQT